MNHENKEYLLQLSIGPVQEFISAARRTRDLWFGSFMLSEISKAAARSIKDMGAKLIFPSPLHDSDLDEESEMNVANVILAKVKGDHEALDSMALKAKEAAQARFIKFSQEALEKAAHHINKERWESQIEDIIEFYAAWVEVKDTVNAYKEARKEVGRLLAARKNLRDFKTHKGEHNVPKSSLDGLRESVFKYGRQSKNWDEDIKIPGARIKKGEALDAIGLIKRLAGDERFPSVSRVAIDPWVRGAKPETLEAIKGHCDALVRLGALSRVKGSEIFPYEGTAVLTNRYDAMISEVAAGDKADAKIACKAVSAILNRLPSRKKPQEPYFALLVADGDKMGKAISEIDNPERHREFSAELSKFAGEARDIVENNYGVCVYTGGDDVLAFLPLDTALKCARELHDCFGKLLKNYSEPTLSVGISIAHAMEDLEELLAFGRDAEGMAKKGINGRAAEYGKDRNGLAIVVRSRGSSPIAVREQWKQPGSGDTLAGMSLDGRLEYWGGLFIKNALPNKFPYELRENVHFYKNWNQDDTLKAAVQDDMIRVFNRKDVTLNDAEKEKVRAYIESVLSSSCDIENLSNELIAAQWIAFGLKQSAGERR